MRNEPNMRTSGARGGRARWAGVALAAAVVATLGSQVAAGTGERGYDRPAAPAADPPTDPYHACIQAGPMTADRAEARAAECWQRTQDLLADPAYTACLRRVGGSADTIERWSEACRVLVGR